MRNMLVVRMGDFRRSSRVKGLVQGPKRTLQAYVRPPVERPEQSPIRQPRHAGRPNSEAAFARRRPAWMPARPCGVSHQKDHILTSFTDLGLAAASSSRRSRSEGYATTDADPGPGHPARARRARPARHRADRHRQDGGVRAADPAAPCRRPPARPTAAAAACWCCRRRASSRPRSPKASAPTAATSASPVTVVFGGVAHRPQIAGARARRRRARRDAGPPARPHGRAERRRSTPTRCSCSTRPTRCSTSASCARSGSIVSELLEQRQNLFFSATMPHEIGALAAELLNDPVEVVGGARRHHRRARVNQRVIHVEQPKKRALLVELLANPGHGAHAGLHAHQARRRPRRRAISRLPASRPPPSTATRASASASRRSPPSSDGEDPRAGRDRHRGARHRHRSA